MVDRPDANRDQDEEGDRSREQGVEFGDLARKLERLDYPISNANLVSLHGDAELVVSEGSLTLAMTLGEMGETVYEDAGQVRQAIFNMVTDEAIGRKGYSDREPTVAGGIWQREHQESF